MKCESLRGLVVCRDFLKDPVIKALMDVQEDTDQGASFSRRAGAAALLEAAERLGLQGNVLRQYFLYLFRRDVRWRPMLWNGSVPPVRD